MTARIEAARLVGAVSFSSSRDDREMASAKRRKEERVLMWIVR
jgi:hypothetical protein